MNIHYEDFFNWNSYETLKISKLENGSSKFRVLGEIVNIVRMDYKQRNLQYQFKVMDETGVLKIKYNLKLSSPCFKTLQHLQLGNRVQLYSNVATRRASLNEWWLTLSAEDAESKIEINSQDSLRKDFLFLNLSNLSPLRLLKDMQTSAAVNALVAIQWVHKIENYQCGAGNKRSKRLIEVSDGFYSALLILHHEPLVFASEKWNAQTVLYITNMDVYADTHGLPELNIEDAEVQVRYLNHNNKMIEKFCKVIHNNLGLLLDATNKQWTLKALEEQTVSSGLQVIGVVNVLLVKSKIKKLLNSKNLFIEDDTGGLKFNNFIETIIDESGCLEHPKFPSNLLEFLLGYSPEEVSMMDEPEICQLEEVFLYRRFKLIARAYGNMVEFFEFKSFQTKYDDDGHFINWII